jgi:hypothetical protein
MKLATAFQPLSELESHIKNRFAEFNRHSSATRGRKYPPALRELVCEGSAAGIRPIDLHRLTGMSLTAIKCTLAKAKTKPAAPRRLEVVGSVVEPEQLLKPLVVRLPSGVTIELNDAALLTPALLHSLAGLEVAHVASR